ncbi:hypothetical protein AALO_G00071630 [Alosa alosa]|uniref:B30.2/SPRY domain-containing protein n=1 Tax=Alosa alosa TaxID=278164 RepID=A0AAV6H455_9TELE|nr:hypothetical protein AALO_G00071630 [Alosa alosa]
MIHLNQSILILNSQSEEQTRHCHHPVLILNSQSEEQTVMRHCHHTCLKSRMICLKQKPGRSRCLMSRLFLLSQLPERKYSCHFTLDPNTAHRHLHLSEGNRRVKGRTELQSYPDHSERFDRWLQVLCKEGVSGRCYWEVEWSGEWVAIAVSYKSISRKGAADECGFGYNDQSYIYMCAFKYIFSEGHSYLLARTFMCS